MFIYLATLRKDLYLYLQHTYTHTIACLLLYFLSDLVDCDSTYTTKTVKNICLFLDLNTKIKTNSRNSTKPLENVKISLLFCVVYIRYMHTCFVDAWQLFRWLILDIASGAYHQTQNKRDLFLLQEIRMAFMKHHISNS